MYRGKLIKNGGIMPFYRYVAEDGKELEKFFTMQDRPDSIKENGKTYERVPEFGTSFILRGSGWVSKGNEKADSPKHGKEIGIAVDKNKRKQMREAGEDV
jgi:predicted nucleic acid-binding Zn ribbon protein